MSGKYALIIGNTEYADPDLAQLTAPGKDAEGFARVLLDGSICAFDDVKVLLNQPDPAVRGAIDEFFDQKKPDDLLVLYFSGHGVRDELGSLYLAVKNTIRSRLRSSAIKSDYIREVMDQSRSKRQVLILDCCNSGAFAQGTKAATGVSIGTASAFEAGYGHIILTASDSTQFAWEGDRVIGETEKSLFTHFLVEGLKGEADMDGDGRITVDELYDYAYEMVKGATPKQTPSKFSSKQQGEIILREGMKLEDIKSAPLPPALLESVENPFADVRLGAVQQLTKLLGGKNLALARSARESLERIAENDDSRQVSQAAAQALGSVSLSGQSGVQGKAKEAFHDAATKEASSKLDDDAVTFPLGGQALITLGWAIGGVIGGLIYNTFGATLAGAVGGAIGGFITAFALRNAKLHSNSGSLTWFSLAWAVGGAVGWMIGEVLTEAIGIAIGFVIGAIISVSILLNKRYLTFNWTSIVWIVVAWAVGGTIGWSIARGLIYEASVEYGMGWAIGMAIGWAIGGFIIGWQLLERMAEQK